MNRNIKGRMARPPGSQGAELENQFILRLPPAQAASLREAIRHGHTNIKDRLAIQLDFTNDKDDMRNGVITIDTIMYKARLMDLPTIMETWKTIDGKNFYKAADVCQMLMVREEEDPPEEEDSKKKRRDPNKVDKKYLWPHGYTPPLKNVRKRRFRKTLRKKNLDLPEIEKEVKRLLRTDNEATSIRWEVIREEDEKKNNADTNISSSNLDEQLFGGALSSSDDEVGPTINIMDEDDDSRLSVDDSRFSESYLQNEAGNSPPSKAGGGAGGGGGSGSGVPQVTDFSGMFQKEGDGASSKPQMPSPSKAGKGKSVRSSSKKGSSSGGHGRSSEESGHSSESTSKLYARISMLENELTLLTSQRAAQEAEIANIENLALKQRFLCKLADIETHIREKEYEIEEIRAQLQE